MFYRLWDANVRVIFDVKLTQIKTTNFWWNKIKLVAAKIEHLEERYEEF